MAFKTTNETNNTELNSINSVKVTRARKEMTHTFLWSASLTLKA